MSSGLAETARASEGGLTFSGCPETSVEEVVAATISIAVFSFADVGDGRMLKVVPKESDESVLEDVTDLRIGRQRVEKDDDLRRDQARQYLVHALVE